MARLRRSLCVSETAPQKRGSLSLSLSLHCVYMYIFTCEHTHTRHDASLSLGSFPDSHRQNSSCRRVCVYQYRMSAVFCGPTLISRGASNPLSRAGAETPHNGSFSYYSSFRAFTCSMVLLKTLSAVNPKWPFASLLGAEAPKDSMPIRRSPYLPHPKVEDAST